MPSEMEMPAAREPARVTARQAVDEAVAALVNAGSGSARLDAEMLLAESLCVKRSKLYLKDGVELNPFALERFRSLMSRRLRGEPVAYIVGRREFWSLDFDVTPAVLVPRPETELLVEIALLSAPESQIFDGVLRILELGTGSGAIAVSLAKEIGHAEIWASDVSPQALEVARTNARRHGAEKKIRFVSGDLFDPVGDKRGFFHLIVSNPPYIRRDKLEMLPRDVRDFEPRIALDGGQDGLDFYRRILSEAPQYLAPGGCLALEIGADMGEDVSRLFGEAGCYGRARLHRDLARRDRVISARKIA